jgi:hypothetical protein
MKYLRFDNKQVRRKILVSDKFVKIREVWEKFIENSSASYKPDRNVITKNNFYLQYQDVHLPSLCTINQINLK